MSGTEIAAFGEYCPVALETFGDLAAADTLGLNRRRRRRQRQRGAGRAAGDVANWSTYMTVADVSV